MSIAFHTDEGSLFICSDDEQPLRKPCKNGDIIKCSLVPRVEHPGQATIEFFLNKEKIVSVSVDVPLGGLHGVIGMMSGGEKVQISSPTITRSVPFDQIWKVKTPKTVTHSMDGVCSYTGQGGEAVGTVRTKVPIDPLGPLQSRSFAVRILDPGENRYIAIGVCSEAYPTNMLPGWEEGSVGYHADNGNVFNSNGEQPTDRPCKRGDVMKFTVNPVDGCCKELCIEFERNGQFVGRATTWEPENGFYGCFGMMSRNEKVQVILPEISIPYIPPTSHFQDVWEIATPSLRYQENGVCCYVGKGGPEHIGTLRSRLPLNPCGPQNAFEVKILDPGKTCSIALGVCVKEYRINCLPGWEDDSIGFHADTGEIMQSTEEQQTGHRCQRGDVIRCTLDAVDGSSKYVSISFHRNGELVARTFMWSPAECLYAQIGAMGVGEVIQLTSPQGEPGSLLHTVKEEVGAAPAPLGSPNQEGHFQQYEASGGPQPMEGFIEEGTRPEHSQTLTRQVGGASATPSGEYGSGVWMRATQQYHQPASYLQHHVPFRQHGDYPIHLYYPLQARGKLPSGDMSQSEHFLRPGGSRDWPGSPADASTASPLPLHQTQPPLTQHTSLKLSGHHPSYDPRPGLSQTIGPVYASQASTMSAASEQEALQSQISTESAQGYGSVEESARRKSDSFPKPFGKEHSGKAMHLSQSLSQLPSSAADSMAFWTSHLSGVDEGSEGEVTTPVVDEGTERKIPGASAAGQWSRGAGHQHSPRRRGKAQFSLTAGEASEGSFARHQTGKGLTTEPHQDQGAVGGDYPDSPRTPVGGGIFLPETDDSPPLLRKHKLHSAPVGRLPSEEEVKDPAYRPSLSGLLSAAEHSTPAGEAYIPTSFEATSTPSSTDTLSPNRELLPIARVIPKEENNMFSILRNILTTENGSLQCFLPLQSMDNAFIMSQLPLSEKLPYFEVEVEHLASRRAGGSDANVAVGLANRQYPPNQLPGNLPGSVGYHCADGCLYIGGENRELSTPCVVGDVIGCRAHLQYKMEASGQGTGCTVKIEYFRNGCAIGTQDAILPLSGFVPVVGLTGAGTRVRFRCDIMLTPENYFKAHPLPESYTNFPQPSPVPARWMCICNSKVSDANVLSMEHVSSGKPAIVQSYLPVTEATPYCEIQLVYPIRMYSLLAIGILPRAKPDARKLIPGEAPMSVGIFPRLGFIMSNGGICSRVPEGVAYPDDSMIGVGIDFSQQTASTPETSTGQKVKVFFTINGQQVQSTLVVLPPSGGFHVTVAVDADDQDVSTQLVSLQFPKHWACAEHLPNGFARGPTVPEGIEVIKPFWVRYADGADMEGGECMVHAVQAAYPLSHSQSYFEVSIVDGGDSYCVSVGLASFNYPLNIHPGCGKDSIAIHADDGHLFLNEAHSAVAAPCQYMGAVIGCGARFPEDGSSSFAEVFFTIDRKIICRRFVSVPALGFFPTVGLRAAGAVLMLDMTCPDPYPDLHFNTSFAFLDNVTAEGAVLQLISHALPGAAQLVRELVPGETNYFEIHPMSYPHGKVFIGYATTSECPLTCKCSEGLKSYALEITTGMVFIRDQYFQFNETASVSEDGHCFGCGIMPVPSSEKSLLFCTVDSQVIYCTLVEIQNFQGRIYPYVYILGSSTRISVNACAFWPPVTPIGEHWARYANLTRKDSQILHSSPSQKPKIPIGFAQAAMPLTPSNSYFEVEVCSRAPDKAIAIGLASKRYPSNTWIGCKNESIAYHLDDGMIFKGNGNIGHSFGPKVFSGHTVGCGIKFGSTDHTSALKGGEKFEVFFTLNGAVINSQKGSILKTAPSGGFFPTVCLESPSESIIFHSHSYFPPVLCSVGGEWAYAYSICQAGRTLEHNCRHKELSGGVPKAFCQAKEPFSPGTPYFEIEITGMSTWSQISAGASKLIPAGSTTASIVDSMMYSCSGQLVTRRGSQKTTSGTQKCVVGDKLGCAIIFNEGQPTAIEIYLNNMKVLHLGGLQQRWRNEPLYPTVILSHPGDAIVPSLGLPLPEWDHSMLIGWLRSERVKLRNNIVEYSGAVGGASDIGVAQVSQPLQLGTNPYYEVEILETGIQCTIAVGLAAADYPLTAQPGWRNNSIAYRGDDGRLFLDSLTGFCFGPLWRKQDIIGVGIRGLPAEDGPQTEVQVYFSRNGEELGHTTMTVPTSGLYLTVGLQSPQEKVKVQLCSPNSLNPARQAWRALFGLKPSKSAGGSSNVLTSWNNDRMTASCGFKLAHAVSREPFSDSVQYFEMKILSNGALKTTAVGVIPKNYSNEHAPGWLEDSIAYHPDSGYLYQNSGLGKVFGPVGRKGDSFGCGISFVPNSTKNCSIFFTCNGVEIGRVRATIPDGGFYPVVCLTDQQDKVSVTFHETFKPRLLQSMFNFVGLMRINNCSYSNQIVSYSASGGSPAVAQFTVPLHADRNYYAANIVKCESSVLVGLAVRDYPMRFAPGYTSISVAYDVTNGCIRAVFSTESFHMIEAPPCEVGDTVGCGIQDTMDLKTDFSHVFFTRNGQVVGRVRLAEVYEELYPVVGMLPGSAPVTSALFMDWNVPVFETQNIL